MSGNVINLSPRELLIKQIIRHRKWVVQPVAPLAARIWWQARMRYHTSRIALLFENDAAMLEDVGRSHTVPANELRDQLDRAVYSCFAPPLLFNVRTVDPYCS